MAEPEASGLVYRAYIDASCDRLYVVAVAKRYDRKRTIDAAHDILTGGLAHYRKRQGIIIVERIGENFEAIMIGGFSQHEEFKTLGETLVRQSAGFDFCRLDGLRPPTRA